MTALFILKIIFALSDLGKYPVSWQYNSVTELPDDVSQRLKRDAQGLFAAVIQDFDTLRVLMVGYMDDEALARTLSEGRVTFWSRSRKEYWRKGDTSGHVQFLRQIEIDCDGDALLLQVKQVGAACHTGTRSCFDAGGVIEPARLDADVAPPSCGPGDRPIETVGR